MAMKGYSTLTWTPELDPHPGQPFFFFRVGVIPLWKVYSQRFQNSADGTEGNKEVKIV